MRLEGKVAIVTGGGSGFGEGIAKRFAQEGAKVVVNDLVDAAAERVAREIVAAGGKAHAVPGDVSKDADVSRLVATALAVYGDLHVVVNNAGQVRMAPFTELTEAMLDAVIDTQLRGPLNVSRPAWEVMAAKGGGRFVNVSSGAAFGGVPGGAVYGMAKMGVVGLGVMGANLARNIDGKGFPVVGYDVDAAKTRAFIDGPAAGTQIVGAASPEELMGALERPRRVLMMVPAGKPVDSVIAHDATEQHDGTTFRSQTPLVDGSDGQDLVGQCQPRTACFRRMHNSAW